MIGTTARRACPECDATGEAVMGHQVNGIYDGVLFWSCLSCGHAWARDWSGYGSRQHAADSYVEMFLAERGASS